MGKFIYYIVNDYSLKINEDIDMEFLDVYIEWFRLYVGYIRFGF